MGNSIKKPKERKNFETKIKKLSVQSINIMENQQTHEPMQKLSNKMNFLPKRIILVRHGESLGNVDESAYSCIPDSKIPLTEQGNLQAIETGKKLRNIIDVNEPLMIYFSPYLRTKQTLTGILRTMSANPILVAREEPRLTEQQFGNFQKEDDMIKYKSARSRFGRFYYRFPDGESGLDVYCRVSSFIGTLYREWAKINAPDQQNATVIIVTHGLTLRLFLMRWFRFSVDEFERSMNPDNGDIIVMTRTNNTILSENCINDDSLDDSRVGLNFYHLDDHSCKKLNLDISICNHTAYYDINDDLRRLYVDANKGNEILHEFTKSKRTS